MGAPEVITAPSKSYVAINSFKSDRSIPPTLCDLGRVSSIAAAVTLPRTSNFITRNTMTHHIRSMHNKKRPISDVMKYSNSSPHNGYATSGSSTSNATDSHKKRRYNPGSQPLISALETPSISRTNLNGSCVSKAKLKSAETSKMKLTQNVRAAINQKINSASHSQDTQRNQNIQIPNLQPPRILYMQTVQISSQVIEVQSHLQRNPQARSPSTAQLSNQNALSHGPITNQLPNRHAKSHCQITTQLPNQHASYHGSITSQQLNQHVSSHGLSTTQLPNQYNVQLSTSEVGRPKTDPSLSMQLQLQNQQLQYENVQLQKQLSLFKQLIKNPQRLNKVIAKLEQRAH